MTPRERVGKILLTARNDRIFLMPNDQSFLWDVAQRVWLSIEQERRLMSLEHKVFERTAQ